MRAEELACWSMFAEPYRRNYCLRCLHKVAIVI